MVSWSNSFLFFSPGEGGPLWAWIFEVLGREQILRKSSLLEQFFCLLQPWQGGTTLGMDFQGFAPRFNSLGKTVSWNNSFVFLGLGKGGPLWATDFQGFGQRFNNFNDKKINKTIENQRQFMKIN